MQSRAARERRRGGSEDIRRRAARKAAASRLLRFSPIRSRDWLGTVGVGYTSRPKGARLRQASDLVRSERRWTAAVFREPRLAPSSGSFAVGVLPGEGVGPEVLAAALEVLSAAEAGGARFTIKTGGPIGRDAEVLSGKALTEEVAGFCAELFGAGGAVLAGPGGSRFVYDLRQRFDLFCKLSPLRPVPALQEAGRLKGSSVEIN